MDNKQRFQQVNEFNKKVHKLFAQTDEGQDVLEAWSDFALTTPSHVNGADLYSIGVVEGRKEFIREIINAIRMAEAKE